MSTPKVVVESHINVLLDVILSDEGHLLFRTQRCADGAIHITADSITCLSSSFDH